MRECIIRLSLWLLRKFKYASAKDGNCFHFGGFRSRTKFVRLCALDPYHNGPHHYASVLIENMLPERTKYVLAASYGHFIFWCRQNNLDHRSSKIKFVNDVSQLMGIDPDFAEFIYYETWRQHPCSQEFEANIKRIEAKA